MRSGHYLKRVSIESGYDFRRIFERVEYENEIVFSHDDRLYRGRIKNISLGGAYIETDIVKQLSSDDIITVSIPFTSGNKSLRRKCRIRWTNNHGFAVEFINCR